jgi:hypothetical protein
LGRARFGTVAPFDPLQQSLVGGDLELYYAPFFGAWEVTSVLKQKLYLFGVNYLPLASLFEGSRRNREEKVGHSCTYELHYFSTLANTLSNQVKVNLGLGLPESKIIQDRAYKHSIHLEGVPATDPRSIRSVDYRNNPNDLTLQFASGLVAEDMRPLGPRLAKIYLNARASGYGGNNVCFCASERSRSVTLAQGNAIVLDTETITELTRADDNHVTAVSRNAVFLVPSPNSL